MPFVHFVLEDMTAEVPDGASFIDIVDATGADVTFGCRNGTCGTCRVIIEDGAQNVSEKRREEDDFLKSIEADSASRLGCQLKIHGNCTINYVGL